MKKVISVLLCAAFLFVMVAACAREESAPAAPGPAGTTAANGAQEPAAPESTLTVQGVTDTEILIGTTFVASGPMAFIGMPIIDTIQAVFARVNAHGGIDGRMLTLIHYDDGNDPVQGRIFLERLLEEDRVFGLISLSGVNAPPSFEYLREFGAPVVNITGGLAMMYREYDPGSNIFLIQPSNAFCGPFMIARAISESLFGPNGDERLPDDAIIGMVYANNDAGHDSFAGASAFAEEVGVSDRFIAEVVTADTYPTVIQQFMAAGVDIVLVATNDTRGFTAAMDDAGWLVPIIGAYGTSTIQSHSPEIFNPQRRILANTWADYESPEAMLMLADLDDALTYHPTLDEATRISYADNNFARAGYSSAITLVKALERVSAAGLELNWENFIWAMESEPFHIGGFGPFDFSEGRRMGITELALWEYIVTVGPGGEFIEDGPTIRTFESLETVLARRND